MRMSQVARISKAQVKDREAIWRVRSAAIPVLGRAHYSPEQLRAWVGSRQADDYQQAIRSGIVLIARVAGRIVGFAHLDPGASFIHELYVDPLHVRSGIGSNLLVCIEHEARALGRDAVRLAATLNALPFYLNRGYTLQGEEAVEVGRGVTLDGVQMQKII